MATGNFSFENRCIVISNDDYEYGNTPPMLDSWGGSHSYPSRVVDLDSCSCLKGIRKPRFYDVVVTAGYYEASCMDYVQNDTSLADIIGWAYYFNRVNDLYQEIRSIFGVSIYRSRKVCGRKPKDMETYDFIVQCYDKLEEYLIGRDADIADNVCDVLREHYEYDEYEVSVRFSNGETWYQKVGS